MLSVLPRDQKSFFYQICRELKWDPDTIQGSHKGAIGPFQFIPETWVRNAVDANKDGYKDPFDVEDAAYSAANYLLRRGASTNLRKALWHYNQDYRLCQPRLTLFRVPIIPLDKILTVIFRVSKLRGSKVIDVGHRFGCRSLQRMKEWNGIGGSQSVLFFHPL